MTVCEHRRCEVCGSRRRTLLHWQKFIVPGEKTAVRYAIVGCARCGFLFASPLPPQTRWNQYYKKNQKYAYGGSAGQVPKSLERIHRDFFLWADRYLSRTHRDLDKNKYNILDVGCGTGHQLSIFKEHGYPNVFGIDPAPECRRLARRHYGIRVRTSTISEIARGETYDLVILQGVLEHLRDLTGSLCVIAPHVSKNGILAISVPDAGRFGRVVIEPFMEFSLEHINYFTRTSLTNLLGKFGFTNVAYRSTLTDSFGTYVAHSLWSRIGAPGRGLRRDARGAAQMKKYIRTSRAKLDRVEKTINRLAASREEIVVWGAGSLTARLMATTNLKRSNILAFVDSNPGLQRKRIFGKRIHAPAYLKNRRPTVLVSSYVYGQEIKKILTKEYRYRGKIVLI